MKIHPALSYTLYRFSLIVAVACVLFLVGFRSWALILGAFVISLPLSWFVLRKQRQQLADRVAAYQERRQAEREELRQALKERPTVEAGADSLPEDSTPVGDAPAAEAKPSSEK